ncbi:inovirus Gp2 family protein [Stenotrophomonas sp. SRS1]|uniref:inovirus Gp2 family protein n=1 Tax=Stenotrophomonas sp. SRS1 TaxID=2870345 RepID=UPI002237D640|nr:inovirus Gp2 family protein [Stenotrophomonas sp. SRS1]MCW6026828.1 inovirus Gp2 family protein [Stenotrophomonas sp. SRS1]
MLKKRENFTDQWTDRMVEHQEERIVLDLPVDYPKEIVRVDEAMRALVKSKGDLFKLKRFGSHSSVEIDPVAVAVRRCATVDFFAIKSFFNKQKLSPYFELLAREFESFKATAITFGSADIGVANAWVDRIREEAKGCAFSSLLSGQERSSRKNARAATCYITELFARNSRLCVARFDLAYSSEYRNTLPGGDVDSARIKRDLAIFLRGMRDRHPTLVGYIWKLEYGQLKSYHIHVVAFFNGNETCQDVAIARSLGEYWRDEVTRGEGGYWNSNAKKAFYERFKGVGIGMVAYDDLEKRERLEHAVLYLTKVDYYVKLNEPEIGRTFGKGQLAAYGEPRKGRPRRRAA